MGSSLTPDPAFFHTPVFAEAQNGKSAWPQTVGPAQVALVLIVFKITLKRNLRQSEVEGKSFSVHPSDNVVVTETTEFPGTLGLRDQFTY